MSITPFCQNVLFCHCWLGIATKLTKRCERGKGFLCKIRISDNHESPQSPHVSALVSLGNSYISMVEQFHQLDYGRFGVLTVQVTNLSAEVFMVCNHIRLIRNKSCSGRWQKVSSAVLPRNCTWHPENLGYRERFHWESALGPPKIVAKKKPGGKPGEFFACYKRNKFICWAQ